MQSNLTRKNIYSFADLIPDSRWNPRGAGIPWRRPPKGRRDPSRGRTLPPAPAHRSYRTKGGEPSRSREPRWAPGSEKERPQDDLQWPSPEVIPTAVTGGITAAEESNRTQKTMQIKSTKQI